MNCKIGYVCLRNWYVVPLLREYKYRGLCLCLLVNFLDFRCGSVFSIMKHPFQLEAGRRHGSYTIWT